MRESGWMFRIARLVGIHCSTHHCPVAANGTNGVSISQPGMHDVANTIIACAQICSTTSHHPIMISLRPTMYSHGASVKVDGTRTFTFIFNGYSNGTMDTISSPCSRRTVVISGRTPRTARTLTRNG